LKQAHLAGRTRGLRPSQLRQAERLSHRRHPSDNGADPLTLERLADLCLDLKQPLHLLIDARGLCRLLWVGPLTESGQLLSHLPGGERRRTGDRRRWRLVSCLAAGGRGLLSPEPREAVVALDLEPELWLRYTAKPEPGGRRPARGWQPERQSSLGWAALEGDDLGAFCRLSPAGSDTATANADPPPDRRSADGTERVLLLTLTGRDDQRNERDLAELEGLVRSAGAQPVMNCPQALSSAHPQTLWGTGKLQEAALEVRRHQASLVITDRELTPVQVRNLERWLDCPVMDRTELILDIFAQRAASAAGRLQVELAQLRYRLPRLIGRGRSLSRQGGGIGTRGPGETQLEKDRRVISRRIEALRRGLTQLQQHRARLRDRRGELHRLALVGYTNAGKSSLLNALCGQRGGDRVLAENKLFATLDPTTRRLTFPREAAAADVLLITDTVGFIRELPEALMEAFKATLEETLDADLLLLVVDLGDPDWSGQLQAVHSLLDALGCDQPRQVVANQIDRCDADAIDTIRRLEPDVLYVSATSGLGLRGLKQRLDDRFWGSGTRTDTLAPTTDSTMPWPS
jgi:GTP-binding protein HflX